jgi:hypothetical protein
MEGKFVSIASKQFVQQKGNLEKSLNGAISAHSDILKTKALEKADSLKQGNLKSICSLNYDDLNRKIERLISKLSAMIRIIQSILNTLTKIQNFVQTLRKVVIACQVLIKLLVFLPIPNRWTTIGITNKVSNVLHNIDLKLTGFLFIITGIDLMISTIRILLKPLADKISIFIAQLKALSDELLSCDDTNKNKLGDSLKSVVNDLEKENNNLIDGFDLNGFDLLGEGGAGTGGNDGSKLNSFGSYKGYRFQIIEEKIVDPGIKIHRRQAIAINKNGIASIQGTPSYATDSQVLIDELKLKIDNESILSGNTSDLANRTNIGGIGNIPGILNGGVLDNTGVDISNGNNDDISSVVDEFNLPDVVATETEHEAVLKVIDDAKTKDERTLEEKVNQLDTEFIKTLQNRASQFNDFKARNLLVGISYKLITVTQAKKEWQTYVKANGINFY